jgi:hypothetical protein
LRRLVCLFGLSQWEAIASHIPDRTARQCRERYEYYLAPNVYNPPWTAAEDELLERKVPESGRKWSSLAKLFPGRNANHLKNRWYKVLVKRRTLSVTQSAEGSINDFRLDEAEDDLLVENDFSWSDDMNPSF